jgi:hypothetical protein
MRQTAAPLSPVDALDQWGIEFPLLPGESDGRERPRSSSLAQVISSWRLSIATVWQAPGDALDQWGIEFPVPDGEFAAPAWYRRRGFLRVGSSVPGGRLREISQAGALAAILAVVVAGSALAVDPSASASAAPPSGAPTGGQPAVISGADSAQIVSLPSIAPQPSTIPNPTLGPTPSVTSAAEVIEVKPVPSIPASAVPEAHPAQVGLVAIPTIQDARNYLVTRLGAKVDRHWGMSQSQCASVIFEDESRWDPHAINKASGAYGLPQANPASKLANWAEAKAGAAEAGDPKTAWLYRSWRDNPVVQAEWGVDYMIERYGSPCDALAFREEVGWY